MLQTTDLDGKTNRLSIYMIKQEFQDLDEIITSDEESIEIRGVGHFYAARSYPKPPAWIANFFGEDTAGLGRILTSSAKGVLIVPIRLNKRTTQFAVVFGFGRYLLKPGIVEERFGLKVVLNSLDLDTPFRSIDKTTLGSVPKHSHEQMSRDVTASDFGIDIEQDLVSSVTGKSRDPQLGSLITGKDSLNCSVKVNVINIVEFLKHCLRRFHSKDYRATFEWIDQITEIRDKGIEGRLNEVLVDKLNNGELEKVWMAVPEVVDWSEVQGFRYFGKKRGNIYDDVDVPTCLDLLNETVTTEILKSRQISMISAVNHEIKSRWTLFRCLYAEISLDEEIYILNNGKWYRIATDFAEQVQADFNSIRESSIELPECTEMEPNYNISASSSLNGACCMDRKLINHGGGHSAIEFCDIYTLDKKLIHVKKYGGSSVLSHLFSQGVVSGEMFVSDINFRVKLNQKLPRSHKLENPKARPNAGEFEVVYGIISESDGALDIPFFSKVSLRNARRRLRSFGYRVSLKKIQQVQV
jgi:uncharacterized protein (TIGR04141 family)